MTNTCYFLALNRIDGIGPRTILKCLKKWPNLMDLFCLTKDKLEQYGFSQPVSEQIANFNFNRLDDDYIWQEVPNNKIITWGDADYPRLLKEISNPPMVLYLKGDTSCLLKTSVAIVGSRKPSVTGQEIAWKFAYDLSSRDITVVSGLALGIDAKAHMGCIDARGKTIAVLGTGIDVTYPRRHIELAKQICENGLLISEFPLKTSPSAGHFPRRNRIISGLASATLVIEAALKSGSLITAKFALEQNRDVLAIPGSIYNMQSMGCHKLLQQGAKLVTCLDDVLDEIDGVYYSFEKLVSNDIVTCENNGLVKYIGFEITSVDQIIDRSGMTIESVMCDLTELELLGVISSVPGGYMRCK